MLSLAPLPLNAGPIISSTSRFSVGIEMGRLMAAAPASVAWTTINQARYVPFNIPSPITVVKLLAYNGATTGGNTDMGLYDANGVEVISIAAAAQAGTNTWQEFDVTDTPIAPGLYYVGLLNTTTTGTFFAWNSQQVGQAVGVYSQAVGAGTLPTPSATFATLDQAIIPIVAIATRVTI